MKFIFLCGGFLGFLTAGVTSVWSGRGPDRVLLDAAVGCLVGALLFRWLWSIFLRGFRETYLARHHPAPVAAAKTTKS
jgi:hypothetical protein